jgi:hypothetical protein
MKIVKAEEEKLIFSDGSEITSNWYCECCEYNYADFTQIDDLAKEWEFENPLIFEICNGGFRFGNLNKMVFVPCYSKQNGYYTNEIEIWYLGKLILSNVECEYVEYYG